MRDKFEEFVRNNSAAFDIHEPSDLAWKGIEKNLKHKKPLNWKFYLSRAAAVIIIFGASFIAQRMWSNRDTDRTGQKMAETEIMIPSLQEAEMYYSGMINAKLDEVKPLLREYPSLEDELHTDLAELDSIYASLKNDLKDNIANHEVIEAMIENYRLRIAILEDMMEFLAPEEEDTQHSINM